MPFDATGRWIPEAPNALAPIVTPAAPMTPAAPGSSLTPATPPPPDGVIPRLNGLLASDSSYITSARAAGEQAAGRRGLLNTSIAAGSGEAAAIGAAAPLASQDATQAFQRNQAMLEGDINLRNQSQIQQQDFTGRADLTNLEAGITKQRDLLLQQGATESQIREFDQRSKEQTANISSTERTTAYKGDQDLLQQQIDSNSKLTSTYLTAFSTLAGDPNIPADVRNAYISEFQRILTQGQALIHVLPTVPLTWGAPATAPTQGTPAPQPNTTVPYNPALNTAVAPVAAPSGDIYYDPNTGQWKSRSAELQIA